MAELIPIPFSNLLKRVYHEYRQNNSIFDLPARKFYRPSSEVDMSVSFCGNPAANPVGPAAGPQTQLTQNIILSWLAGSRILELKTVQINDRLELSRPCIDMATIGYNTEWSQELKLDESLREYAKASMIIEILKKWLQLPQIGMTPTTPAEDSMAENNELNTQPPNLDTIFDVSVGYDLAGIRSREICRWLQAMRNASQLIAPAHGSDGDFRLQIPDEFAAYRDIPFKTEIANSITLSTFHGTPANEIERICEFLLVEMDYHVTIKMNPPMLGKERIEYLLYDKLGYTDIEVNEKGYEVNITFSDAVDVVRRLQTVAARHNKTIGVKFGNTLEVLNKGKFLKDNIQYLSGQPLHVLHLALVDEWRKAFGADFPISFSAGVDANNFADCVAIGLVPITSCTDLLRPGGYGRLPQYLHNLEREMKSKGATNIPEFIVKSAETDSAVQRAGDSPPHSPVTKLQSAILKNTSALLQRSIGNPHYHYQQNNKPPRKIGSRLHLWDCINCDKCIPVCPNDANFYFEVEPFEIQYKNIEIDDTSWRETAGGIYKVAESHQIATVADACNDCGNCDVFCPEDGGPYIEKPRFFCSLESWQRSKSLSGFCLTREQQSPVLYGRFRNDEYSLSMTGATTVVFQNDKAVVVLNQMNDRVLEVRSKTKNGNIIFDMSYYVTMKTLLKSMLDTKRIHFVNVGVAV